MIPIHFDDANLTLTKPKSMTDEQCFELTAFKGVDDVGLPYILTGWQPNKEDIEAINAGRPIYIKTTGEYFAPMAVFTIDEKGESNG